jgi:hypothetical protein
MSASFQRLGLAALRARRRLKHHPDRTGGELNEGEDQCLQFVLELDSDVEEREFTMHICRVLTRKMAGECDVHIDLCSQAGMDIIRPTLCKFYRIRTVDAMEWILCCAMGDMPFDQAKEDEIPILCRYYNDFIGEAEWTEQDRTMMTVLNKYDTVKAGGYGNFARAEGS